MPSLIATLHTAAKIFVLASFFVAAPAAAQSSLIERFRTGIESVRESFDMFGEKTGEVLPPVIGLRDLQEDLTGLVTSTREFDQQYAANKFHTLALTTSFGAVRVQSWENQVIRIMATVSASAANEETAAALAQSIAIHVDESERQLTVATLYPDPQGLGKVDMKVTYDVYLPRDTSVVCTNSFADTEVVGISGDVSVDSRFGALALERIAGAVTVRTRGPYPVAANGLQRGGSFVMRGALAKFSDVGGALYVKNNDGTVELRNLRPEINADVVNSNGPVHIYLPEGARPDLEALVLFGEEMQGGQIQSEFPLDFPRRGSRSYARIANSDSTQKISLQTSFETVYIHREGDAAAEDPFHDGFYRYDQTIAPRTAPCPDGFELVIDAIPGDITIRGADVEEVIVAGTRNIRVERQDDAEHALAALDVHLETVENRLHVRSELFENLPTSGAVAATLSLDIQCPRTIPVRIRAARGQTTVEGTGAPVTIEQQEGAVVVQHCKGMLDITAKKGDIALSECEGPVVARGSYGTINVFNIFGRVETQCYKGTTIVEAAQGDVVARSDGGDVRIIATEIIGGSYDVAVEGGTIGIILSPRANATVFATTKKGVFYNRSGQVFSGTKMRDVENFSGTFNEGLHNIKLNAISGDVIITQEP